MQQIIRQILRVLWQTVLAVAMRKLLSLIRRRLRKK